MDKSPFDAFPSEIEWEEGSPDTSLLQSFNAVMEMINPVGIRAESVGGAGNRLQWARISILFSAFAAEGYINRTLMAGLSAKDFDAVDRLPTIDKYALGPRLVGADIFSRGTEPLQTLAELFTLRNRTAHPKPKTRRVSLDEAFGDPDADTFRPTLAVKFLTAVADAANALQSLGGTKSPFPDFVLGVSDDLAARATALEALPRPTAEDYRAIYGRMVENDPSSS